MSRLVFGESLSPAEVRRVQITTWAEWDAPGICARFDLPRCTSFTHPVRTSAECAACRFREHCAIREDDSAARSRAIEAAIRASAAWCRDGERLCCEWPLCGHDRKAGENHL